MPYVLGEGACDSGHRPDPDRAGRAMPSSSVAWSSNSEPTAAGSDQLKAQAASSAAVATEPLQTGIMPSPTAWPATSSSSVTARSRQTTVAVGHHHQPAGRPGREVHERPSEELVGGPDRGHLESHNAPELQGRGGFTVPLVPRLRAQMRHGPASTGWNTASTLNTTTTPKWPLAARPPGRYDAFPTQRLEAHKLSDALGGGSPIAFADHRDSRRTRPSSPSLTVRSSGDRSAQLRHPSNFGEPKGGPDQGDEDGAELRLQPSSSACPPHFGSARDRVFHLR